MGCSKEFILDASYSVYNLSGCGYFTGILTNVLQPGENFSYNELLSEMGINPDRPGSLTTHQGVLSFLICLRNLEPHVVKACNR